ncbi:MAG: HEAT repeat domain-containing protein [Cyanobium sp.]
MTIHPTPPASGATAALIAAVEQADSAAALLDSSAALARHLAAESEPSREAVLALVQVLGINNPGAAVAAVDGLIACGEKAVEPLLANLDAHNYGARAWAVRALAGIGDVRGLELLEQALGNDIGPSVRRAAARGLGQLRCGSLGQPEQLVVRHRALTALEAALADGEWVVRYAVVVGLESLALDLTTAVEPAEAQAALLARATGALRLRAAEGESTQVVRLRAVAAVGRLDAAATP